MKKLYYLLPVVIIAGLVIAFSCFSTRPSNDANVEPAANNASESEDASSQADDVSELSAVNQNHRAGGRSSDSLTFVPPEKRYALLIGINKYKEPKIHRLMSCVKDMTDLKDALVEYAKFKPENITLMTDDSTGKLFPTAENIRQKIEELKTSIPKDAMLIVAFSGHGTMIDMQDGTPVKSYLCAHDTSFLKLDSYIDREWLFKTIDECPAEKKLLFCDACRSLSTKTQLIAFSGMSPEDESFLIANKGISATNSWNYNYIFMSSCSEGQVSFDSGVNSLFIAFLLEGIRTGAAALQDGDLTVFSWFDYASKKTILVSRQRLAENPRAGVANQKEQTPRINIPLEMSSFIIAKLERPKFNIIWTDNPNDIPIETYTINGLEDIEINNNSNPALIIPVESGNIQLPSVPEEIAKHMVIVRGIVRAIEELKSGTHPVLDKPKAILAKAKLQYDSIKAKRDDMWRSLDESTRKELERQIASNPDAAPTSFDSLKPNNIRYSEFIKLVVFGKKAQQAKLAYDRVENDIKTAVAKQVDNMVIELEEHKKIIDKPLNDFCERVLLILLEKCDGFNNESVNSFSDEGTLYLADAIPTLLDYDLGWDEKMLWDKAKSLWNERRPCILNFPGKEVGEQKKVLINGVKVAFRWCPAGSFVMGSPESEDNREDNETQHQVTLTSGFWMMETEVTQELWKAIMGTDPSEFKGDDLPVENVSWDDCQAFCKKCADMRIPLQLPTEAQWEYSCRAGTTDAYAGDLDEIAWYDSNSEGKSHPVGTKKSNAWGLFDLNGNVDEWCNDFSGAYPNENVIDPSGASSGESHVYRGGSWHACPSVSRSASRCSFTPLEKQSHLGFRCVVSVNSDSSQTSAVAKTSERNAGDRLVIVVNGAQFAFRYCPAGTFTMGSPESEEGRANDEIQHEVTLSKGYWIMETEVTQKQWQAVMGYNPSNKIGDNLPVEQVSWNHCQNFCKKCAEMGIPLQLPTEAQWEYACRAGTTEAYAGDLKEMAWYKDNGDEKTQPVGTKKPNAWGIFDMHGNVYEWCADMFSVYSSEAVTDPVGISEDDEHRVSRGGSSVWFSDPERCRSAARRFDGTAYGENYVGFRCILSNDLESLKTGVVYKDSEGKAGERMVIFIRGAQFAFRYCPAGTFTMGSPESEEGRSEDEVQHQVTLTKGYWMMETEVTQQQWQAIMGNNPSKLKGENLPVGNVSWGDSQKFCQKCDELGIPLQLPTEAQWEYACRAGTTEAHSGDLEEMGWCALNSEPVKYYPVGTKKPNPWGLYDMYGNLYEWCSDWYGEYPAEAVTDPTGPSSGEKYVDRGGSCVWFHELERCRSAARHFDGFVGLDYVGFRCMIPEDWRAIKNKDAQEPERNAGDRMVKIVNGVEFAFRYCPAGTFMMGSPESEEGRSDDEIQHEVTLSKGFWIMETEITQKQWQAVMGNNPSKFEGDNLPVDCVSWVDSLEFCRRCADLGMPLHLPTEAQWEYACRAGTTEAYGGDLDEVGWYNKNSNSNNQPVGTKAANAWGIYDMHGNVCEWCMDGPEAYPSEAVTDPLVISQSNFSRRVFRGGGCNWYRTAPECRSAKRFSNWLTTRDICVGCRCILSQDWEKELKSFKKPNPKTVDFKNGKKAGDRAVKTINGVEFAFRYCPAGTFMMGSPESEEGRDNDETQHQVTLTKGFWIMETEVTQKQWQAVMGYNPSSHKGENYPVESATWNECQEFCKRCSELGIPLRLPTEAQWEYACRAGTTGAYAGNIDEMAWYKIGGGALFPVGLKKPNAWGLYDMCGNVAEWCSDFLGDYPSEAVTDPVGPSNGEKRIARGSFFEGGLRWMRSADRGYFALNVIHNKVGFRGIVSDDWDSSNTEDIQSADNPEENIAVDNHKTETDGSNAGNRLVKTINGVEFAFRYCPAGTFMMGSPESEKGRNDDEVQHQVTLTKGFWMMETEVTQKQWQAIMRNNSSKLAGKNLPVNNVSWGDCLEFCKKCADLGMPLHLPTEAQWEYACRAGTAGAYAGNLNEMAWYSNNGEGKIHPVGTKNPNAWGIFDMHGNVWEWCMDGKGNYSTDGVTDPFVLSSESSRVTRGGSWFNSPLQCRSAIRHCDGACLRDDKLGCRFILSEDWEEEIKSADDKQTTTVADFSDGKNAGDRVVKKIYGVEFAFRYCPAGTFTMGSPESEVGRERDEIQHQVTLTKGFWMLETEVTQKQWQAVMEYNPSSYTGINYPVESVSWHDCRAFCKKCEELGLPLQLPTEAQWEYACRAGTTESHAGNVDEMAWYQIGGRTLFPVGLKKPNAWGLYDMHGNVWEWCFDMYSPYPSEAVTDPIGSSVNYRVSRGGCFLSKAQGGCRSADRNCVLFNAGSDTTGFRCVVVVDKDSSKTEAEQPAEQPEEQPAEQPAEQPEELPEELSEEQPAEQPADTADGNKESGTADSGSDKKAGDRFVKTINGVEFAFRYCPAGTFMMGSPESEEERGDDEIQHQVTLSKGFWIMETEVTQKQWQAVMGKNPSKHQDDENLPVECVSWADSLEFCKTCADLGMPLHLPTEAQWEYACRAGSTGTYAGDLDEMAWYGANGEKKSHPVGTKKPNAWGVFDMHGNVCEWCMDGKEDYPSEAVTDPFVPSKGDSHVSRGGGSIWRGLPLENRSAKRFSFWSSTHGDYQGVRCVLSEDWEEEASKLAKEKQEMKTVDFNNGKNAGDRAVKTINGVEFAFRYCPAGTFTMGSPESEEGRKNDEIQHQVTLTKGFWMMEMEVTQKQWQAVMGNNPSSIKGDNYPVETVSWNDCQEFCKKCAESGIPLQLPTEAQWEYACRAGTTGVHAGNLDEMAWYRNGGETLFPVGLKKPNPWGLYDMHGNVWEWCSDLYGPYPREAVTDPVGASNGEKHILRGGNYGSWAQGGCRSADRYSVDLDVTNNKVGLRCVISADWDPSKTEET